MSVRVDPKLLRADAKIVSPPGQRACDDRTFGLPWALHAGFFGLFLAYLGVMAIGLPHPEMAIPMAIFVFFTIAFYVVPMLWAVAFICTFVIGGMTGVLMPMLWAVMAPANASRAMRMSELLSRGIAVHTGRCSGGAAIAQVLILPLLILLWGIAVVTIAALV